MMNDLFVCGILRNSAKNLKKNYSVLRSYFMTQGIVSSFFFYENDSTDNTVKILEEIASTNRNFSFKSEKLGLPSVNRDGRLPEKNVQRVQRMCRFRNEYLKELQKREYAYDRTLVVDLDMEEINVYGIEKAYSYNVDMVGANGRYSRIVPSIYYDCWALAGVPLKEAHKLQYNSVRLKVQSCFGGMGLYKTSSLVNSFYDENCQHIEYADHGSLHEAMRNKGYDEFYICPQWITYWR